MSLLELLLPSLLPMLLPLLSIILLVSLVLSIYFLTLHSHFKNSNYNKASGNSFFKTAFNKGLWGEFLTFEKLEKLQIEKELFTNVYLPKDGKTTEIDLIMLTKKGVFVFESKNYSGWIYGSENQRYWTQTLNKTTKNKFYNPIWQNNWHITAIKTNINAAESNLHSYIIFSERCTLKNIKLTNTNIKILKRNDLISTLNSHLPTLKNTISDLEYARIKQVLLNHSLATEEIKKQHIKNLNQP